MLGSDLTLTLTASCTFTVTLAFTTAWDMHWQQLRAVWERQWAVLCPWPLLLAIWLVRDHGCTAHDGIMHTLRGVCWYSFPQVHHMMIGRAGMAPATIPQAPIVLARTPTRLSPQWAMAVLCTTTAWPPGHSPDTRIKRPCRCIVPLAAVHPARIHAPNGATV